MIPIRDDQPRFSTPYVTYFLVALNVVIFLMELSVGSQSRGALNALIFEFGVVPKQVLDSLGGGPQLSPVGAIIPIFTSMFLHGSWLHIIGNMWVLWIFGDNIEDYLGHFKYLLFYFASGLGAGLLHILF